MEQRTNTESEFCACFPQYSELWMQNLAPDSSNYAEPVLMGDPTPDFCEKCRKPMEKHQIIIQGVPGNAPPDLDVRFEDA